MSWFSKKKKKRSFVPPNHVRSSRNIMIPGEDYEHDVRSREYKLFKQSYKRKVIWYERLVKATSKIVNMNMDNKTKNDLKKAIAFTGLNITPAGVGGLFVLVILLFVLTAMSFAILNIFSIMGSVFLAALGMPLAYYLLKYPINLVKQERIEASSQVVLAILYMVISMRISPNLERALRFTASNIRGALAWDMRKLIWDIEMRKYYSAYDALSDYIAKWKPENEEFAESLRLIRESQKQVPKRSKIVLDQALEIILNGTKTRMKHYVQDLKMPVMVIHMMGIVLPILGIIITPLAAIFMSEFIGPLHFIIVYDLMLPIVIIVFINNVLRKRPVTLSQIDIRGHPNMPPPGRFSFKGRMIPVMPIAIIVFIGLIAPAIMFFINDPMLLGSASGQHDIFSLLMSCMIILSMAASLTVYYILSNFQKVNIQNVVQSIEGESELALFQLGNRISGGTPIEVAIEKSISDVKDLKIVGLFRRSLHNIKTLGMTFESSLFHKQYGALRYYPSKLLKNIMRAVVDTSRRGLTYASEGMMRIAKYLKNIRITQEYIRDMLSDTVSSMKFQAYFLTPIITGLIVSMSQVIMKVLVSMSCYLQGAGEVVGIGNIMGSFASMESSMSPEFFQLIIGVYMIQVVIILVMFITRISVGDNRYQQKLDIGKTLVIAVIIYIMVAIASTMMFTELIEGALLDAGVIGGACSG